MPDLGLGEPPQYQGLPEGHGFSAEDMMQHQQTMQQALLR